MKKIIILTFIALSSSALAQNEILVTGLASDRVFTISGSNSSDLYVTCVANARAIIEEGGVFDLFFSVNNNRFVSKQIPSGHTEATFCEEIEIEVKKSIRSAYTGYFTVSGVIESWPFYFEANSRANLLTTCISKLRATMNGNADDMRVSLDGQSPEDLYTSGWWKNSAQACKALIQNIDSRI